jgi:signal transduction histidine kinase
LPGLRTALEESFRCQVVTAHPDSHLCIPFDTGAVALASHESRDEIARANAEAIVARLGPIVTSWLMEREAASRRALVRQLALRIFTAIDEERARIARDLHDNQAQLLAAAKIALEGGREEARAIFKQIEDELRRRTRELRPATLGRATLDEAIEREFHRLATAGISAKLVHARATLEISRPVQQLCFQVVREALSNVIRHACAKSVEVTVERTPTAARISIIDDGRGINPSHAEGTGLSGVRERLELMGGSLTVDSRAGRTIIVAEIPEP